LWVLVMVVSFFVSVGSLGLTPRPVKGAGMIEL